MKQVLKKGVTFLSGHRPICRKKVRLRHKKERIDDRRIGRRERHFTFGGGGRERTSFERNVSRNRKLF